MPLIIQRPRETLQFAADYAELIESISGESPRVPGQTAWAQAGESQALPAEHPPIWIADHESRVDCGQQSLGNALVRVDNPDVPVGNYDYVLLVRMQIDEHEPFETRLEVPHPHARTARELDNKTLAADGSPFRRKRGGRRTIGWQTR